ncbi:MAG: DUF4275 family protein [Anaerocolumna sp.]
MERKHYNLLFYFNYFLYNLSSKSLLLRTLIDSNRNKSLLKSVVKDLKKQQIPFKIMPSKKVREFKRHWFHRFTPIQERNKAKKVCFGAGNYLWHLYSYRFANCLNGEEAITAYNNQEKNDCYLLISFYDIVVKFNSADKFRWHLADCYQDIIITDKDFKWTFAFTHEGELGPYFATSGK